MSAGQHVFATLAGMSGESRDGVTLDCRRCAYVSDSVCVLKNIVDKNLSAWYRVSANRLRKWRWRHCSLIEGVADN